MFGLLCILDNLLGINNFLPPKTKLIMHEKKNFLKKRLAHKLTTIHAETNNY